MSTFKEDVQTLRNLGKLVIPVFRKTVNEENAELKKDQEKQLDRGEDRDGRQIKPGYTSYTKRVKARKGQQTRVVNWKDTGRLRKRLQIRANSQGIVFDPKVAYGKHLIHKYNGGRVLGIQEKPMNDFIKNNYLPELNKAINVRLSK